MGGEREFAMGGEAKYAAGLRVVLETDVVGPKPPLRLGKPTIVSTNSIASFRCSRLLGRRSGPALI